MATSKILLGPIPHARYDWVSGASYGKEAIVFHKGSSYIALSDNPSTEPSFTYDPATGLYNVSAGWGLLAVGTAIVQETGDSQDKVMSQKAVTDALTASDQKLSELESKQNKLVNIPFVNGYYINLRDAVVGATISPNRVAFSSYCNADLDCLEGEVYILTTKTNTTNAKAYCITDADGVVLMVETHDVTNKRIEIPTNAAKLYVNSEIDNSAKIEKVVDAFELIEDLESETDVKLTDLGKEIATKQGIIPDLDSIRSGAALGASALQKETDPNVPSWAKASTKPSYTPAEIGAASEESLQIHENDNIRHITASERTKWNEKQDALTLTVKDNGNIVIGNIQGQTKEFMPATPSGDPMHYAYEAAGAEWNGTGADIVKATPWADLADDDADKTVVHKAGYWYLNGLGDITTEQMRAIYNNTISFGDSPNMNELLYGKLPIRTNFNKYVRRAEFTSYTGVAMFGYNETVEVICLCGPNNTIKFSDLGYIFTYASVRNIIGIIKCEQLSFSNTKNIKTIKITSFKNNVSFKKASMLTSKSILYMIQNEAATSAITITLHADAYARAMANADILAALEAHPNVSLASA